MHSLLISSPDVAIVLALAYSDQFFSPLLVDNLKHRVLKTVKPLTHSNFLMSLEKLVQLGIVQTDGKYIALNYRIFSKLIKSYELKRINSTIRSDDVAFAVRVLAAIPWIIQVYVTGSLAVESSKPDDDIDFLIVTKKDGIWISRLLVVIVSFVFGKKRSRSAITSQGWCFNAWLEVDSLSIFSESSRRTLYTVYELLQAKIVFDRLNLGNQLQARNSWFREWLSLPPAQVSVNQEQEHFIWSYFVRKMVNHVLYVMQTLYMQSVKTKEQVCKEYALFHPRPTLKIHYSGLRKSLMSGLYSFVH